MLQDSSAEAFEVTALANMYALIAFFSPSDCNS